MNSPSKTDQELMEENALLKQRVQELEKSQLERKRLEEEIKESRELLDTTQQLAKIGGWEWIVAEKKMTWTDETYRIHGMTPGDPVAGSPEHIARSLACYDLSDRPIIEAAFRNCAEKGESYDLVFPLTRTDGRRIWIQTMARPVIEGDLVVKVTGNILDITERKQAEESLRQEKEWSETLIKSAPNIVIGLGEESRILLFNSFAENLTGYKAEEVIGKSWIDLFVPAEIREQIFGIWDDIVKTKAIGHRHENLIVLKNGQQRLIEWYNKVLSENGVFKLVLSIGTDITDRVLEEKELRESLERFRVATEASLDSFLTFQAERDGQGRIVDFIFTDMNTNAEKMLQLPREHLIGRRMCEELPINVTGGFFEKYKKVVETGVSLEEEFSLPNTHVPAAWHYHQVVKLSDGVAIFHRDITERKQADEIVQTSAEKFSKAFHSSPILTAISMIEDGRFLDVNEIFLQTLLFSREEIIGKTSLEVGLFANPAQRQAIRKITEEKGYAKNIETQIVAKNGQIVDGLFSSEPIIIDNNKCWLTVMVDITEQKRAEEKLRESELKYRSLFETSTQGILIFAQDGIIQMVNPSLMNLLGAKFPEELVGHPYLDFVHPDDRKISAARLKKIFCDAFETPRKINVGQVALPIREHRIIKTNGEVVEVESTAVALQYQGSTCIQGIFRDISERKRSEEALREAKGQMENIIEFLPDPTLAIDNEKHIIIWNRAIEEMTGIPAQEMIGKGDYAYTIPFYGEARPQLMDLVLSDNEEISTKYPQIHRQGDTFVAEAFCNALHNSRGAWVYAKAAPLRDQKGNIKGAIEIIRDITEQKHYEDALKDYQRNLADVINFLPDATFVIDKDGIVTAWNNAMASMTGIKAEEMIGKGNYEYAIPFYGERRPIIIDLILSADDEFLSKSYDEVQRQESVLSGEVYVPKIFEGKGAYLWGNASRLYNSRGEVIGAIQSIRDITDRRQAETERRGLEERLQRAEKMESLGLLAGGVAHDLNNVLGIVVGYAEMLIDEMDKSNPMRDDLKKILEGGNRSAAIVQDLLTLARRGVQTKKVVNLNAAFADCQKTPEFEKVFAYNPYVKLRMEFEPDLLNIMGSPVHLSKTIINLASNAVEAMPNGGILKITTTNQYLDMPIHGYDNVREGDYVVLTVSDTGEGIQARDIKRIFEPFYTKKIMGRSGTGLGLAVVWGTIKDHNGYINVESTEGKGTTFTLYFPVTREDMESEQISLSMSEYMGDGETILIVDDVNRQRELASRMLSKLNYIVSTVASGEEAIEYLKNNKADLIVLDMIMEPGIDGLETYESILKLNPVQKAVIVSGFSESDRVKEAQRIGAGAYVPKPYVLERLGMAVRKELDRK